MSEGTENQAIVHCRQHGPTDRPLACTRCGTLTCPQCLTPAAVGSHCPDCIRAGARRQRVVRTPFGARSVSGWHVSTLLVIANVAVYIANRAGVKIGGQLIDIRFDLFHPAVANGEWWRLLTSTFLHATVIHLAFNMAALIAFGPQVEAAMGRIRFAGLYFLAALGGSAAGFIFGPPGGASVGASGAIFGIFAAYFVIARRVGADTTPIVALLGINLLFSFASPIIDWRGHVGGMVTGALAAWAMAAVPRVRWRAWLQAAALLVILLALIAGVAYRTSTFPALT
jgi:membrane associated rhomboid family serine protease